MPDRRKRRAEHSLLWHLADALLSAVDWICRGIAGAGVLLMRGILRGVLLLCRGAGRLLLGLVRVAALPFRLLFRLIGGRRNRAAQCLRLTGEEFETYCAQILKDNGEPILKMCVDTGADIDTYTDQVTRVIATRQKDLAKRAEETANRRAEFRAKVAAEKAAEAEAVAAGKSPEEVEEAIKAAAQALEDAKKQARMAEIEAERESRRKH